MKINWFLSHPIQYFSPLFRELSTRIDLSVFYYSDSSVRGGIDKGFGQRVQWDMDLLGGYHSAFIENRVRNKPLNNRFLDTFNPGVFSIIKKNRPSVVIVNGWSYSSDIMAILFGRMMGSKVWLRAENPYNQEIKKKTAVRFIKKIFLFPLFRVGVNKCLYIGKENEKFFRHYGVSTAKLLYTPYAVDNQFFSSEAEKMKAMRTTILERLNISPEKKIILFCGKYIPKKNPMDLLKAFHMLNNGSYALVMVGEGELRPIMEKFIKDYQLNNIVLAGFVNQSEISVYYSIADLFVMCSGMGETWGLAVNEAMNFSKPVIVSDTSGCSADLVVHGENGFVFPEGDIKQLAGYIQKILEDETFRLSAGARSAEIIKEYSISRVVNNICEELARA